MKPFRQLNPLGQLLLAAWMGGWLILAADVFPTVGGSAAAAGPGYATKVEPLTRHKGYGPEVDLRSALGEDIMDDVDEDASKKTNGILPSEGEGGYFPRLYEHSQLRDELQYMNSFAPTRQRVAIRAVEDRGLPVFYPPYHWLPDPVLRAARTEIREAGGRDVRVPWSEANPTFKDHSVADAVMLLGLLNIRVYEDATGKPCCAPHAELIVELVVDDLVDARQVGMAIHETSPGVYYVSDPIDAAHKVVSEVISFGERPLMSIVGLRGVDFEKRLSFEPIAYSVRWGNLELEYGAHYAGDPKGLIR